MTSEQWVPARGCPGYIVSSLGNIQRVDTGESDGRKRPRKLKPFLRNGRSYVATPGSPLKLAELVLSSFTSDKSGLFVVEHLNGDALDCALSNLRWTLRSAVRDYADELSLPGEAWRDIPGYEGFYQVSDKGRVKTVGRYDTKNRYRHPGILAESKGNSGYQQVHLKPPKGREATYMVHRLMGEAFLGPKPKGLVTRHLDGDKSNNVLGNLVYGTYRENSLDVLLHGNHQSQRTDLCIRGHLRKGANAVKSGRSGVSCRACGNTASYARTHPGVDFQAESDRRFEEIMQPDFEPGVSLSRDKLAKLTALVEDCVSLNEIQRTLGCSHKTVRRYFPDYKPFERGGGGAAASIRETNRKLREFERRGKIGGNRDAGFIRRKDI